ncbi:hypothetical protein OC835_002425 [Tilletia horrida]|nr:hypothetical protein OC835_002425 [Tilletia horrida]
MSSLNPFAAAYRTRRADPGSSSPVFRPNVDATSSPSPPSSPILRSREPQFEGIARPDSMLRPRTPPGAHLLSSPPAGSGVGGAAFEPPMFTSSSPSLDTGSVKMSHLSSSPSHRASLEYPSSFTSTSSSTAASSTLGAHHFGPFSAMHGAFSGAGHPHTEGSNSKRGLKRPLPTSPEKPSLRTLGSAHASFQPTASGSLKGRRTKRATQGGSAALTLDDELALDLAPAPAAAEHARDDVFRTLFGDSSDSSDESWPDSSSPPRQAIEVDEGGAAPLEEDESPAQETAVLTGIIMEGHPASNAGQALSKIENANTHADSSMADVKRGLGLGPAFAIEERRPPLPASSNRMENPYRRTISRPFNRIASSGLPHPLSASYIPSPPARSPAHSRPRLDSPIRDEAEDMLRARVRSPLGSASAVMQNQLDRRCGWHESPRSAVSEAEVWAEAASNAFAQCETSIVLDGRGLTYIDPMVADLGKMVTLPPPRASPPPDTTPGASVKRRSTDSAPDWIPNLKFGGLQLNLANNHLTVLPSALFQVENLRVLSLRGNNIRFLPPAISELTNLKELSIGGNSIEYLPAEIQKLRLTTFNFFPNPFRKPPKSLPCPTKEAAAMAKSSKTCLHPPRFRVRTTWEQMAKLSQAQSSIADIAPVSTPPLPERQPAMPSRAKAAALSLRPLLLTNRSFGQITFVADDLRTPSNPLPDDPLNQTRADDSTPLASVATSNGSVLPWPGSSTASMPPPPAPFRVSEQGPRFANPSHASGRAAPLHTPTRMEEGTTIDMLQLGVDPASTDTTMSGTPTTSQEAAHRSASTTQTVTLEPPDVRAQIPSLESLRPSGSSRRPRNFDRTRSERQIIEVLESTMDGGQLLGSASPAGPSTAASAPLVQQSHAVLPAAAAAAAAAPPPSPASSSSPSAAPSESMQIENGRASYVGPTEPVSQGDPPLLGELCFRVLLGPSEEGASARPKDPASASSSASSPMPTQTQTPLRAAAAASAAPGTPSLVLDQWDRDELARLRNSQNLGVLRTLEAARQSAGRTWGGSNSMSASSASGRGLVSNTLVLDGQDDDDGDGDRTMDGTPSASERAQRSGGTATARSSSGDAALDACANPWFSRCPNPAHIRGTPSSSTAYPTQHQRTLSSSSTAGPHSPTIPSSDWPIPPTDRIRSPLFSRPAESRLEWVSHVAGLRIARASVNTSVLHHGPDGPGNSSAASLGQLVDEADCLPILWRGCSKGCLDFLGP